MSAGGISLSSLLPAPSQSRWDRDEERQRAAEQVLSEAWMAWISLDTKKIFDQIIIMRKRGMLTVLELDLNDYHVKLAIC